MTSFSRFSWLWGATHKREIFVYLQSTPSVFMAQTVQIVVACRSGCNDLGLHLFLWEYKWLTWALTDHFLPWRVTECLCESRIAVFKSSIFEVKTLLWNIWQMAEAALPLIFTNAFGNMRRKDVNVCVCACSWKANVQSIHGRFHVFGEWKDGFV